MEYRPQIASDVIRDGLGVELIDATHRVCAEVFRCDADNTFEIQAGLGAKTTELTHQSPY